MMKRDNEKDTKMGQRAGDQNSHCVTKLKDAIFPGEEHAELPFGVAALGSYCILIKFKVSFSELHWPRVTAVGST
eukprot:4993637-Amphidinium_carterae.1